MTPRDDTRDTPALRVSTLARVGDSLQSFGSGLLPDDALPPRGRLPHVRSRSMPEEASCPAPPV
jgi:hypothetical protein